MSLSLRAQKAFVCCSLALGVAGSLPVQASFLTNGVEYPIAGAKPGDQVHPALALNAHGGFLVWEDNITSPTGLGISALRLDRGFSGSLSSFRVNSSSVGDHERAQVALLNNGGAAFVWQGGPLGYQHIYARFLSPTNTWLSEDILVNSSTNFYQQNPAIATLQNGNVVVVWNSFSQYNQTSLQDVYGQILTPDGQKVGNEFLVNQFVAFNQRTPAVAAVASGFAVAWVSEQQRVQGAPTPQLSLPADLVTPSVDIYARTFTAAGSPLKNEFIINSGSNICANPSIATTASGEFMVAWSQKDIEVKLNSWDIYGRIYSAAGAAGPINRINTQTYGDQIGPQVRAAGSSFLVVWTSLAQDNSMDGVFGQFFGSDGSANDSEFQVNTTWVNKQMHPAVASDGAGSFLVSWTSYIGGRNSFDLFAQRYVDDSQPLVAMAAPYAYVPFVVSNGVYQPRIVVSWPAQAGLAVDHYQVYVDGAASASPATNSWTMTAANGLNPSSSHSFQLAAVLADGRTTPLSAPTTATAWGGYNWGGIPFEWMAQYYGMDSSLWPSASSSLAQAGPTLAQVFLTGGNPHNSATWLRTSLSVQYVQGQPVFMLNWNTQPGQTYQVQTSSDMTTWVDLQSPRFAADMSDSVPVPQNNLQYYRLVRLR
jgi:hypothetical protein